MNIKKDELMENYAIGDEIFQEYISEQISKELKNKLFYYQKYIGIKENNKYDFTEYAEIKLKNGIRNSYKKIILCLQKIQQMLMNKLPMIMDDKEREKMQNDMQNICDNNKKIKLNKIYRLIKKY